MSNIESIIEDNVFCVSKAEGDYEEIERAMKTYAEYYALKCLEIASKEAKTFLPSHPHLHGIKAVDEGSIRNITLPSHEE